MRKYLFPTKYIYWLFNTLRPFRSNPIENTTTVSALQQGNKRAIYHEDFKLMSKNGIYVNMVPGKVFKTLVLFATILLIIHFILAAFVSTYLDKIVLLNYLDSLLNMNNERNIPSFFSVLVFTTCSALLAFIYKKVNPTGNKQWLILSLIFLFLAFDEAMEIHEKVNSLLKNAMTTNSAALTFPWVLPYLVFFAGVAIYLAPFVLKLPAFMIKLVFLSGFVFVVGAIGLEVLEGIVGTSIGEYSFLNLALMGIEEYMEIIGVLIFIYALLIYITNDSANITISLQQYGINNQMFSSQSSKASKL